MAFRDFDPDRLARLAERPDPIEFGLAGRRFTCLPVPPPAAVQALAELPELPSRDDPGYVAAVLANGQAVAGFIRSCLVPPHRAAWDDVMLNEFVDDVTLVDLLDWLGAEYRKVLQEAFTPHEGDDLAGPDPVHADRVARARRLADAARVGGEVPPAGDDPEMRRVYKLAAVLLADPEAAVDELDPDLLSDDLLFGAVPA